jgi:hypothetical protein
MKKQIFFKLFIFQFFFYLILSLSIVQNSESSDSQAGCKNNSEWQQNAPWWGWTPAHDNLKAGNSSNCSQGSTKSSNSAGSSASTMSSNASSSSSDGCSGAGNGGSFYGAWWGWTPAHDNLNSSNGNCGQSSNQLAQVNNGLLPENFLILFDEAKAFKAAGPKGESIKGYEIDLSQINEKPFKLHGAHLAEILDGDSYRGLPDSNLTFSKDGKSISSDLEAGKTYVAIKSQKIGRVANTYDMLCAVNRVRGKLKPGYIKPICEQILCSPDFIESSLLFEKFSELSALKGDMKSGMNQGSSISNLQLGGLGLESKPGGRICNMCTKFSKGDVVIPSQDCAFAN